MSIEDLKLGNVLASIEREYNRARKKHPHLLRSSHEGYGVLKEEVDEAWDEIKGNRIGLAKEEMVQVAAMALAFILEVPDHGE